MPDAISPEFAGLFYRLSFRYRWDSKPQRAMSEMMCVIRRTMNDAVPEDRDEMERIAGRARLVKALKIALFGAFLPSAWRYWHERLGLVTPGEEPPPMPNDRYPEHGD